MRKTVRIRPVLDALEGRIVPGTLTVVNKSTGTIDVQIVRHIPATSGQLGDGTSFNAPTPAYTESTGYFLVKPGSVLTLNSGDSTPYARITRPGGSVVGFTGSGISKAPSQYAVTNYAYDIKRTDGSSSASVVIRGHSYGSIAFSSLGGSAGTSIGVRGTGGFYRFNNNQELTISGPRQVTGTSTQSFADYCGNTSSNYPLLHFFRPPAGAHITSYTTNVTSARGDNVHFSLARDGSVLTESGTISGGGLFSYGGSYVGTVSLKYAY